MVTLLAYVSLGILADIFIARYYMALSARRAWLASLYAVIIPLFTFGVIERAMTTRDWKCVVGFVIGNGAGTYWAVKRAK
jgi:hypothetical protein